MNKISCSDGLKLKYVLPPMLCSSNKRAPSSVVQVILSQCSTMLTASTGTQ